MSRARRLSNRRRDSQPVCRVAGLLSRRPVRGLFDGDVLCTSRPSQERLSAESRSLCSGTGQPMAARAGTPCTAYHGLTPRYSLRAGEHGLTRRGSPAGRRRRRLRCRRRRRRDLSAAVGRTGSGSRRTDRLRVVPGRLRVVPGRLRVVPGRRCSSGDTCQPPGSVRSAGTAPLPRLMSRPAPRGHGQRCSR